MVILDAMELLLKLFLRSLPLVQVKDFAVSWKNLILDLLKVVCLNLRVNVNSSGHIDFHCINAMIFG